MLPGDSEMLEVVHLSEYVEGIASDRPVFIVRIKHFFYTGKRITRRAALVADNVIDNNADKKINDLDGNVYSYLGPDKDIGCPDNTIGLITQDTKILPEEGLYKADFKATENPVLHYCHLTPQFERITCENDFDKIYLNIIHRIMVLYSLWGVDDRLPSKRKTPKDIKVSVPQSVFIKYPQRPSRISHDFTQAAITLTEGSIEVGPTVDLYNQYMVLSLGRAKDTNGVYRYGALLQRQDAHTLHESEARVYTLSYSVHNCVYWEDKNFYLLNRAPYISVEDPFTLIRDIEELIILAFYMDQYEKVLLSLMELNDEIKRYLSKRFIFHKFHKEVDAFAPITCLDCNEAKFVQYKYKIEKDDRVPCNECRKKWAIKQEERKKLVGLGA